MGAEKWDKKTSYDGLNSDAPNRVPLKLRRSKMPVMRKRFMH